MSIGLFIARTMTATVHLECCSIIELTNAQPTTTLRGPLKAYLFAPVMHSSPCQIDWMLVERTIKTKNWNSPLQRACLDVFLHGDECDFSDSKEYGFQKLHSSITVRKKKQHPTYGVRGAISEHGSLLASGLVSFKDVIEELIENIPKQGMVLMEDGYFEVDQLVGRIDTTAQSGKRIYIDPVYGNSYADHYKKKKQRLIRGRRVSHCKNLPSPCFESIEGSPDKQEEVEDKISYAMLQPELCLVHPLSGQLVRGTQRLPSMMRRVESMLLAIQLKNEINYPIATSKVLEALTAASCQEPFSYERTELLGDAVLKWVVSRWLFLDFPQNPEGQLTLMRQQNVSNTVLYQRALEKGLEAYIQTDCFSLSWWTALGIPLIDDEDISGKNRFMKEEELGKAVVAKHNLKNKEIGGVYDIEEIDDDSSAAEDVEIEGETSSYRSISRKTLADVVEALIGTFYVEGGEKAATHLMNWVGIPSQHDPKAGELARADSSISESVFTSVDFDSLESALKYSFKTKSLLVQSITHASVPASNVPCYQRLEFLGDAVLDYLITRHLFFGYTDLSPGRLTDLRAAAVNNENFARVAIKHKLHLHLRHACPALDLEIHDFAKNIEAELEKPCAKSFGVGYFKAPKVLGDIVESIAGAILLDSGLDTNCVWKIFEPLLQPLVTPDTLPMNPVRELQERCQQQAEVLEYKSSREGNLATIVVFVDGTQVAIAQHPQRKMAQKLAAWNALNLLEEREASMQETAKIASETTGKTITGRKKQCQTLQILHETCQKQHWHNPQYSFVSEGGSPHAKKFTYSVRIHTGSDWTEECVGVPMPNIKSAKDSAAQLMLQRLRLD